MTANLGNQIAAGDQRLQVEMYALDDGKRRKMTAIGGAVRIDGNDCIGAGSRKVHEV